MSRESNKKDQRERPTADFAEKMFRSAEGMCMVHEGILVNQGILGADDLSLSTFLQAYVDCCRRRRSKGTFSEFEVYGKHQRFLWEALNILVKAENLASDEGEAVMVGIATVTLKGNRFPVPNEFKVFQEGLLLHVVRTASLVSRLYDTSIEKGIEVALTNRALVENDSRSDQLTQKAVRYVMGKYNFCTLEAVEKGFTNECWSAIRIDLNDFLQEDIQAWTDANPRRVKPRFATHWRACRDAITKGALKYLRLEEKVGPRFDGDGGNVVWLADQYRVTGIIDGGSWSPPPRENPTAQQRVEDEQIAARAERIAMIRNVPPGESRRISFSY